MVWPLAILATPHLLTGPPDPPLAGPAVRTPPPSPSLVAYTLGGAVRPLGQSAEEAALDALDLSPSARAAAQAVIARRARAVDDFVLRNLDLLTQFGAAAAAKDGLDLLRLTGVAWVRLAEVRALGPVRESVSAALPTPERDRFEGLVRDHWRAAIAERRRGLNDGGEHPGPFEAALAESVDRFGKEVERSFRRLQDSGELVLWYVTHDLDLTADQHARIREIVARAMDAGGLDDRRVQERAALGVLAHLNEAQREKLIRRFRGN